MDESEAMQSNGADERCRLRQSRIRALIVAKGFDVSVPEGCTVRRHVLCLESKLRDVFSHCGKIKSVCIPHSYGSSSIKSFAYIEILGEGAKEKALQLRETEMCGCKLVVTALLPPFKKSLRKALKSAKFDRECSKHVLIVAKGFDVSVPEGRTVRRHVLRLESELRDLFSSCGKVKSVCIPHAYYSSTIKRYAYIEILGKKAIERALKLSGSEMDGHKLVVTPPLRQMKKARRKSLKTDRYSRSKTMDVRGYDTSLPRKIIKSALVKHFSSCGEVVEVEVMPNLRNPKTPKFAYVSIYGEGAKEKALQLNGSDMGGFKLVVDKAFCPIPRQAGDKPRAPRIYGYLPLSEDFPNTEKSKENPNTNKRKENPNSNKKKKKKQKTSK